MPQSVICPTLCKKVYKVGLLDADFQIRKWSGNEVVWTDPYYQRWVNMLARCYSKYQKKYTPSYKSCEVCDEWLVFSNFKSWMEKQDWHEKELDKDLFGCGKFYSPDTCCFVTKRLNLLLASYPRGVGVCWMHKRKKWRAYTYDMLLKKQVHIGVFEDKLDAIEAAKQGRTNAYLVAIDNLADPEHIKERAKEIIHG